MARLSKRDAERALRQVVRTYGAETRYRDIDRTYYEKGTGGQCRYIDTKNNAKCIVGKVLVEVVGVDAEGLKHLRVNETIGTMFFATGPLGDWTRSVLTKGAQEVLGNAQYRQDMGRPWGEAVAGGPLAEDVSAGTY